MPNLNEGRPNNAGLPWIDELKLELAGKYQNGVTIEKLSKHFERTRGAIVSELVKQGIIEPGEAAKEPLIKSEVPAVQGGTAIFPSCM